MDDSSAPIGQVHDAFFKSLFAQKENALALIQACFPAEVLAQLDLTTLTPEENSYLDENLQKSFADLIYSVAWHGKPLRIALLFEHKSQKPTDEAILLQLLRYQLNFWETRLKNQEPLCPIIPLVFYHGKQPWQAKSLAEVLQVEAHSPLRALIPDLKYLLVDLSQYPDAVIKQLFVERSLQIGMLLMKHIFDKAFLERLAELLNGIDALLEGDWGRTKFKQILLYLLKASKKNHRTKIIEIMQEMSEKVQEESLSIYDALINEGIEKGIEQGIEKGIEQGIEKGIEQGIEQGIEKGERRKTIQGIQNAIEEQIPITLIAKIFKVSEEFVRQVQRGEIRGTEE
jgi:predicted transposase YdaD